MHIKSTTITYKVAFAGIISATTILCAVILMLSGVAFFSLKHSFVQEAQNESLILADGLAKTLLRHSDIDDASLKIAASIDASITNMVVKQNDGTVLYFYSKLNQDIKSLDGLFRTPINEYQLKFDRFDINVPVNINNSQVGELYITKSVEGLQKSVMVYSFFAVIILAISIFVSWLVMARVKKSLAVTEDNLYEMAHIDSVTSLYNRHSYNEQLNHFIKDAHNKDEAFAVVLLDLDDFKVVNDTLGHIAGDALLKTVGENLKLAVRKEDVVARIGGDEFALILRGIYTKESFNIVGRNILEQMSKPCNIGGQHIYISCSIGGALFPSDAKDSNTLLQYADLAMYAAKNRGKNCFRLFDSILELQTHRKSSIASNLRKGIENKEFRLVYQPQFHLQTERIVGVEALIRWHSEDFGMVSPDEFIRIAEESGQMHSIGEWIINTAMHDVQAWNDGLKYEVPVAINISTTQLQKGNIEDIIIDVANRTNFPMYLLELEITESALMENVQSHIETFKKLQEHGIGLSIDDFGTGYSSMSYLQKLPLDTLKIDKSFVNDIASKKQDVSIAKAIIALAHTLSLKVVAEGVETEEQASCLKDVECDIVQGFLYAKPMRFEELVEFLKSHEDLLGN